MYGEGPPRGEREGESSNREKKRQKARYVLGHSITPPLAHPTRLRSLQAPPGTTTRHTVSNTMGHLVDHDVVFHRSVTAGLKKMEYQNALSGAKSEKMTHVGKCPDEHPTLTRLPTTSTPIISSSPILPKEEKGKKGTHSGGVAKFALLTPEASCMLIKTLSPSFPPFPRLLCWKLNAFSVNPYRYAKSCMVLMI